MQDHTSHRKYWENQMNIDWMALDYGHIPVFSSTQDSIGGDSKLSIFTQYCTSEYMFWIIDRKLSPMSYLTSLRYYFSPNCIERWFKVHPSQTKLIVLSINKLLYIPLRSNWYQSFYTQQSYHGRKRMLMEIIDRSCSIMIGIYGESTDSLC